MINKSSLLVIGSGGCGNRQLNEIMDLDGRYTGIFMNTNMSEMEDLKYFERQRRCFYVANADGTGKQRDLADMYIKEESPKFIDQLVKFTNQNVITLMGSVDGGTGSKAIILLTVLIKKHLPNKSVNLIATFPSMNEGEVAYNNTIETWNELLNLKKRGYIDSIQFVDNNKYDENTINKLLARDFDDSFNLVGDNLDNSDLEKAHLAKGYKVMLRLDKDITDVKKAIDTAIKKSCFYVPDNWECDVVVGSINTKSHNLSEIKDTFEAFELNKFNTKEDGDSFIVLGGCEIPTEPIQLIKECLKEVKKRKRDRVVQDDLIVRTAKPKEIIENPELKPSKSKLTADDLRAMQKDDSFWDF